MAKARAATDSASPQAWHPAPWAPADATAIQALSRGEADSEQQQRALRWIIEHAAGTYDVSYRADSDQTVFAEGRRFVGLQIVKLIKVNVQALLRRADG